MQIAITSGKGGTGKTAISVNLARAAVLSGQKDVTYIDCDVEEPNGHIFIKPIITDEYNSSVVVPKIDKEKCIGCAKCRDVCQFNAIICFGNDTVVFPELCHSCEACFLVCRNNALSKTNKTIGTIKSGYNKGMNFIQGELNVGLPMSPPVIKDVKKNISLKGFNIIDCPPGTSCPVVESIKDSDYVILVTEPTPFGFYDLKLAIDVVKLLKKPFGVIVNRSDIGNSEVEEYCMENSIDILLKIKSDKKAAILYSKGLLWVEEDGRYLDIFSKLYKLLNKKLIGG